jgi:hypothetical protein
MGRFFLILLAALGVALYFPTSRAVIAERLTPLRTPVYRWMTEQELAQIVEDLAAHEASRGTFPSGRGEFDPWMENRYPQLRSRLDAWGNGYRLESSVLDFRVLSAGADGVFGTADDLVRVGTRAPRRGR